MTSYPVAATAIILSSGSCASVASRIGTLLTIATRAPLSRGTISSTEVFSYSTYSDAPAGLRTFALSEARSRNTTLWLTELRPDGSRRFAGFRRRRLRLRRVLAPVALRRRHAAPGLDLDSNIEHGHFRAGDAAQEHELVQIAQMADAEQLAR